MQAGPPLSSRITAALARWARLLRLPRLVPLFLVVGAVAVVTVGAPMVSGAVTSFTEPVALESTSTASGSTADAVGSGGSSSGGSSASRGGGGRPPGPEGERGDPPPPRGGGGGARTVQRGPAGRRRRTPDRRSGAGRGGAGAQRRHARPRLLLAHQPGGPVALRPGRAGRHRLRAGGEHRLRPGRRDRGDGGLAGEPRPPREHPRLRADEARCGRRRGSRWPLVDPAVRRLRRRPPAGVGGRCPPTGCSTGPAGCV